jgi:hypothetical protein
MPRLATTSPTPSKLENASMTEDSDTQVLDRTGVQQVIGRPSGFETMKRIRAAIGARANTVKKTEKGFAGGEKEQGQS